MHRATQLVVLVVARRLLFWQDLKKWLDESKDGVVYFTLGSMVNIETMPDDDVKGLYAAFARIAPVRVLMKVANKDKLIPGLPKNVITSSWIPQVPVLGEFRINY